MFYMFLVTCDVHLVGHTCELCKVLYVSVLYNTQQQVKYKVNNGAYTNVKTYLTMKLKMGKVDTNRINIPRAMNI